MNEAKFKVGNKVKALRSALDILEGNVYEVSANSCSEYVCIRDEVGEVNALLTESDYELVNETAAFKVGDRVKSPAHSDWGVLTVIEVLGPESIYHGEYRCSSGSQIGIFEPSELVPDTDEAAQGPAPTTKVRILERGKLLDTEFDSPVAAGDWLRDNGITGEFELVRVESLGKVRAVIKLEDA